MVQFKTSFLSTLLLDPIQPEDLHFRYLTSTTTHAVSPYIAKVTSSVAPKTRKKDEFETVERYENPSEDPSEAFGVPAGQS
ncbi:hypothetical protein SAPIO_CDS1450 [Scedosporium apiospermum]|uniref:Uncharacterized protein n=1 Tax=Pseudallescheria apiosperma TaxID=563466 RepID=A0A084GEB7_PSEDA|nr:uncharacterized protein SAPIO_CDS1450 [Scedosporium apiospermum]KEZ45679.1 hypothetical protein SAPIO_CDS1450 [Scedosporium apiospermum]